MPRIGHEGLALLTAPLGHRHPIKRLLDSYRDQCGHKSYDSGIGKLLMAEIKAIYFPGAVPEEAYAYGHQCDPYDRCRKCLIFPMTIGMIIVFGT